MPVESRWYHAIVDVVDCLDLGAFGVLLECEGGETGGGLFRPFRGFDWWEGFGSYSLRCGLESFAPVGAVLCDVYVGVGVSW